MSYVLNFEIHLSIGWGRGLYFELLLQLMNSRAFNRFFYFSLAVLAIIYIKGMTLDLMDVDASTYALLARQMFQSGNYLQLYLNGIDYLDKPPLLFWSACLSFKIFGIHDWAYRLPSVLCLALGIYSVYRYAKLFYSEQAAKLAALIMASCMASYVMTSDVRADTMLTGWVMFSIWQLAEYFKISNIEHGLMNTEMKGIQHLLLGAMGIGFAMITKGPIGLIIPVTAFAVEFAYKRQWKNFFRWQYFAALIVIALILLPMSYGLYEQFDAQPLKKVHDQLGISGLRFYYWTQSFGRITGESTWSNNPDPFFLYHSFLWSFAPWCVFFIPALFIEIKHKIVNFKKPDTSEAISVGGFVLILIFLSRSHYQLPHYTFAIHPLAAVMTAKYLDERFSSEIKSRLFSVFYSIHILLLTVIYIILFLIVCYVFPASLFFCLLTGLSFCTFIYFVFISQFVKFPKILLITLLCFATLAFIMNTWFYPNVLAYQTGSFLSKKLNKEMPPGSKLLIYKDYHSFSMQFYGNFPVVEYMDGGRLKANLVKGKTFILTDTSYIKEIQNVNPEIVITEKYYSHSTTLLNWKFLNPSTRIENVDHRVLMQY
jgi:4-amino-4-deoxy-L-arabinose transferase-like glycosyltransferase